MNKPDEFMCERQVKLSRSNIGLPNHSKAIKLKILEFVESGILYCFFFALMDGYNLPGWSN